MVDKHELRRISLIEDMPDSMLEVLGGAGTLKLFSEGTRLFSEGQVLDQIYMVLTGTILLEVQPDPDVIITLDSLESGACFGLSSMIPGGASQSSALCAETCELICFPAQELLTLLEEHQDLGYQFMYRIMQIFKARMDHRTRLFLRALQNHPELQHLFSSQEGAASR